MEGSGVRKYCLGLIMVFILIFIGGCSMDQKNEEQQIIDKATEIAIQHFKETEHTDIVVTKTKFAPKELGGIFVIGYVKGNKERKVTATIHYNNNYEVESITLDSE